MFHYYNDPLIWFSTKIEKKKKKMSLIQSKNHESES